MDKRKNITNSSIWLYSEFIVLFFGVPLFILFFSNVIHPSSLVIPVIIGVFIYLRTQHGFKFKNLLKLNANKTFLVKQGLLFVIIALFTIGLVYLFDSGNLFNLPKGNPKIWLALCVFYPIFSAFGQEIIYRLFIFKRYQYIFKTNWAIILASSISFGFVHIIYYSPISLILSFFLGIYLCFIYLKTNSILLVAILHGIYGNLIFTVGLGGYFWLDMYKWL